MNTTNLVALHDARKRAEALLARRFAEDIIDHAQLEKRLDAIQQATRLEEIHAVTVDLMDPPGSAHAEALVPAAPAGLPSPAAPSGGRILAVLGETQRRGRWTPDAQVHAVTVMGALTLDYREALLGPGITDLRITTVMGSVTVVVPPGLPIEVSCIPILGSTEVDSQAVATATQGGGSLLRISGMAVMGSVEVLERAPGQPLWGKRTLPGEHQAHGRSRALEHGKQDRDGQG